MKNSHKYIKKARLKLILGRHLTLRERASIAFGARRIKKRRLQATRTAMAAITGAQGAMRLALIASRPGIDKLQAACESIKIAIETAQAVTKAMNWEPEICE